MWIDQRQYKRAGRILAAARKEAGLNQAGLANALKKPQSFVSAYESGQRRVDVLEILRIAKALKLDPNKLFSRLVGEI